MTPDELLRVLQTDRERQRNVDRIANGGGWPTLTIIIITMCVLLYVYWTGWKP